MKARCLPALGLLALGLLCARPAAASEIWSRGSTALRIGGEFTGTAGPVDRGYFNDTDYGQNLLRQARLSFSVELTAGERFGILAEARAENMEHPRLYALYVRARPLAGRPLDLQAGLIPPVFGRFARAGYGADNPLIGDPLAYQYLTTLRANVLPPGIAELLRMRGNGWRVGYGGYLTAESGLPMVAGRRWDTGIEARVGGESFQVAAALTQGSLSEPRVRDDNDGKQISARAGWRPAAGLVLGLSGARGEYLEDSAQELLPPIARDRTFRQRALGTDLEYARAHWVLRSEAVWTAWDAAAATEPLLGETLTALAWYVEGKYVLLPGFHVAARYDRVHFGDVQGPNGPVSWEAPVWRIETGVGFAVTRQIRLKGVYQHNEREAGFVRSNDLVAVQGAIWF
jgi:hypothetical protein